MAKDQRELPGTEDPELQDLADAAHDYVKVRDRRMKLTTQEVGLKANLLELMRKHKRTTYNRDGIEIVVTKEEKIKVSTQDGEEEESD